ncbi:MAG: CehA/McbA family metallohydrolase [Theionarchaea archaeon]|nr:CehA/McbA family metallohydrolase [Theionarchaea archaeon]
MGTDSFRIRCLRTVEWRRAWETFTPPAGAAQLRICFVLDSPTTIEMEMRIDDVGLEQIEGDIPQGQGRLNIRALLGDVPTLARFFAEDENGEPIFPRYSYPFKEGLFYHLNDPALNYLDLPPGKYKVRATKGPEFEGAQEVVEVQDGAEAKVELRLQRVTFDKLEWLGGDHHVHLFFHKHSVHPQMTVDDVMKIAKGEGLNFVSFCGEWSELEANLGNHEIAKDDTFVGQVGLESVNDFYGHTCTMGWTDIPEQGIPLRCVPWPMNTDTIESLKEMGGAWIHAHPFDRITPGKIIEDMGDTERLCNARELPIILALGHRTCFDILCHATPGGAELKTTEYYRLLNMGFKIGITASTDFYVDQARGTPGHNRTYVRAPELEFGSIAEAYRLGRTYATNTPLVDFEVEGTRIGDELVLDEGREVSAKLVAFSRMGLDSARVILNGEEIRTIEADGNLIREEFKIPIGKSSWVAIHVQGPVNDDIEPWDLTPDQRNLQSQFAHTSPVYIRVGDVGISPKREDVEFLLAWIDAARKAFHDIDRIWDGHPDESYLASSYSDEERARITSEFESRAERAKSTLLKFLERE